MTLGGRLRELRLAAGLGLRDLARRAGISPTYLSRIETSDEKTPSEDVINHLADQVGGGRDELMRLAGRIPSDVRDMLLEDAGLVAFLRDVRARGLRSSDLRIPRATRKP